MILHILMLIFYLSVIYLPTKRLTEQCKSFSQLIVSFTQMSCYNVYVPLLLEHREWQTMSKKILNTQYMLLIEVKQYVLILTKGIQTNLGKMLVNNV